MADRIYTTFLYISSNYFANFFFCIVLVLKVFNYYFCNIDVHFDNFFNWMKDYNFIVDESTDLCNFYSRYST